MLFVLSVRRCRKLVWLQALERHVSQVPVDETVRAEQARRSAPTEAGSHTFAKNPEDVNDSSLSVNLRIRTS
jgi:hypothetical protein